MLSYLAENSFLPSAGLPLGLVECLLGGKEKVDGNSPTLHISQAISSYAPGNPVVKNEWVYETNGIRLKTNTMTALQGISYRIALIVVIQLLSMEVLRRIVPSAVGMELCMA